MSKKKYRYVRIGLVLFVAVLFWTIGAGFHRDLSASSEETYKSLKTFSDVLEILEENYVDEVDTKKLIEKAIEGMVNSLDPHSALLPPEAFEDLKVDTKGKFGGVGIVISMPKGILSVISPIENTPAHKAGVKAGDIIIKIDGVSTKDMMIWEAVKKMRGPKGTQVVITIVRKGATEPIDFKIIRDIIPIESVKYMELKPGYGYIRITNFQNNTTSDLKKVLKEIKASEHSLKGLILDLRDNPGGLLDQAVGVSDLFLDEGIIVSIKGRHNKHSKVYNARTSDMSQKYPIAVLISGGSASASEIVAGALQDHKRGVVIGTSSFGKGSVQSVETLRDGYGLKYTIARYYTPSGRSIQAKGIEPDIVIEYKIADEPDDNATHDARFLKEKDLKNHLEIPSDDIEEGDSESKDDSENMQEQPEQKDQIDQPGYKHGILNEEALKKDNQVMYALDILIGYGILKGN
jgi:carboxyl-terminal processing protease